MRSLITSLTAATIPVLLATASQAVLANDDSATVAQDIIELKKGQEAILRELSEIRKLLAERPPAPARPPSVQQIDASVALGTIAPRGNATARLTMIEFSDYQCPFCRRHTEQTVPQLVAEYVQSGKLRYAFRDFPLVSIHPNAAKAAEAARCAGDQAKYWDMHDRLFANQKAMQPQDLMEYANAIGLDEGAYKQCLDQSKYAGEVKKDIEDGEKLGVSGTPTFVIGISAGDAVKDAVIIRGALPFAMFKAEIEKLLSNAAGDKN